MQTNKQTWSIRVTDRKSNVYQMFTSPNNLQLIYEALHEHTKEYQAVRLH